MVNMHMSDYQGPDMFDWEINGEIGSGSAAAFVLALEQAAVYEDAAFLGPWPRVSSWQEPVTPEVAPWWETSIIVNVPCCLSLL